MDTKKVKEKTDKRFTQETYPHSVILMGMMNEIDISSQDPKKKGKEHLVHDAEKCSFLRKVQSQVRHVHWTRFRRNIHF